ncbi:uncharacterized protein TrAFT101_003340 [Trichoderma asperellum]|uniref:uncharacterized protein n=1 Tax=Trichoderma asperellum TaxID=101201 RepID=UPI00331B170E|nr:hypothetical protein TrAFT101_003340 [Trichoderma asperellum]
MSDHSIERTTRLHDLEIQYQKSRHDTELIDRDEEARRLELRVLLLEDENTQLQDRCAAKIDEIKTLSRRNDRLRVKLDAINSQVTSEDEQIKNLPIEDTGAETSAATAESSSRAVEENAALTKELRELRSEVKLLRLRVADDEKSTSNQQPQKHLPESASEAQSKSNDTNEETIKLQSMLDKTTERIAEEERHRERMKVNHQKQLDESKRKNNKLEEQVLALERKLKDTQTELRELRQASHSGPKDRPGDGNISNQDAATKSPPPEKEKMPRKRVARKRATEQAKMGEKSTFSITPLLNKIKGAGEATGRRSLTFDDILLQEGDDPSPLRVAKKTETRSTAAPVTGLVASTPLRPRDKLGSKPAETQPKPEATSDEVPAAKPAAPSQDAGDENPEDTNGEGMLKAVDSKETALHKRIKLHESTTTDRAVEFEQKKRRRKLINKANTIIEEDETGEGTQPTEAQPGRARKLKSGMGSAFNSGSAPKPFSPLKRHKRGMNASFLV